MDLGPGRPRSRAIAASGGREVLRVTRITTADPDKVVALLFEQHQRGLHRFRDRALAPAAFWSRSDAEQFPFFCGYTEQCSDFAVTAFRRQHPCRLAISRCSRVRAFCEEHI